jgi:hypothetical protein
VSKFDELFTLPKPTTTAVKESSLEDLLTEIPVPLDVFLQDKKYLGMRGFTPSPIQTDFIRHAERIYFPGLYPRLATHYSYWDEDIRLVNYLVAQWGKGGGKDSSVRFALLRAAYLFMCLKDPQLYYKIPEDDDVHMLNIAINADQAQKAFFNPLKKNVNRGWFKDRVDVTNGQIIFDKSLIAISGHSKAESQEGLNLLFGVCDEIDGFKTQADVAKTRLATAREAENTAEHIMNMMESSSSTRFPEVFKQIFISYPRYLGSTIQNLTEEGNKNKIRQGKSSKWYVSGPFPTWEVNPNRSKKDFDAQYQRNKTQAEAKYECKPKHAADPYFKNTMAIEACIRKEEQPAVTVEYYSEGGRTWTPKFIFRDDFYPIVGARYAMHADLALTGDKAGVAMSHVVRTSMVDKEVITEDGPKTIFEPEVIVTTDFVIAFEADITVSPPREIQIRWARELWGALRRRGFHIPQFSYDGYNCLSGDTEIPLLDGSTKTLKELEDSDPFWLYAFKDGKMVPGKCTKAWKTGFREDMLEVELDNGAKIKCTSDHPFMLRDGAYLEAQNLELGQSLMPYYKLREFGQGCSINNHKVVAIRSSSPEDVYDLTVEGHHNFALSAGVFVHNSVESRQTFEAMGIQSPLISTDRSEEPWKALRDLMESQRISLPDNDSLKVELFCLTKKPNGKVDHTTFSSKDQADALACSAVGAIMMGGEEDPMGARAYYTAPEFIMGTHSESAFSSNSFDHMDIDFNIPISGEVWEPPSEYYAGDW